MSEVRLPLPVGLRIESILSRGITKQSLSQALKKNSYTEIIAQGADEDEAAYLFKYALEHREDCISAVELGYQFKFLTIRGLKKFLILKYDLIEGEDLIFKGTSLEKVRLKKDWLPEIESAITRYWKICISEEAAAKNEVTAKFILAQNELQV
ncbi:hypothetical protein JOC77_002894 [Peribacillus deserti]|uniref:DUF2507 domain-containing protein n=1 Tax=Peribacillus deserti TaxID=673318 RepID=A0ABS2QL60_9BACI|nr:hypothetical protein [Peribacillus deserti]MBM7693454.1 hypothetical protein [Peribacillus deserti]